MTVDQIVQVLTSVGLPVMLILGAGWFIAARVWPFWEKQFWPWLSEWFTQQLEVDRQEAIALQSIAYALDRLSDRLDDGDSQDDYQPGIIEPPF